MISGIKHIAPPTRHSSVVKLKLRITRERGDERIDISGFCIAAKAFGTHPKLSLIANGSRRDLAFKTDQSARRKRRFGDVSLNAEACDFHDIRIVASDLPAELVLTSEDGSQTAHLAQFDYHPVERIHDQLIRQVENEAVDLDVLDAALSALPEETQTSDEGVLMAAVLNVARHGYNGTGEANLRALRRIYRKRERLGMYPRYVDLLNFAIAPMVFGNHGLTQKFADLDLTPDFWTALNAFLADLDTKFGPTFLVSGSLLGLIREGRLLPHDDDLDIAIMMPATNAQEAAAQWAEIRQQLKDDGLLNEGMTATARLPILKSIRIEGVPTDLFPAWMEGDKVFIFPHTFGDLEKSDVLPLIKDENFGVPIPKLPEKMLEINYGAGWRVPDPAAKLDWARWNKNFRALTGSKVFADW